MALSRPRRGRIHLMASAVLATAAGRRLPGAAVLDLSSSCGSTISTTTQKTDLPTGSSPKAENSNRVSAREGNPENCLRHPDVDIPVRTPAPAGAQPDTKRGLKLLSIIRRGKARKLRTNDSALTTSSCSSCGDANRRKSKIPHHSRTFVSRQESGRQQEPESGQPGLEGAAAAHANANDRASTSSQTSRGTEKNMMIRRDAEPHHIYGVDKDEDEYSRAAEFLAAFHSRTVAVVRATELDAIDEGLDSTSVDESSTQQSRHEEEHGGLLARRGCLNRRNGASMCLSSLVAAEEDEYGLVREDGDDDNVPDLTDEFLSHVNSGSTRKLHDWGVDDSARGGVGGDTWGQFFDDSSHHRKRAFFSCPSSVQHYGMVGGMRASARLHPIGGRHTMRRMESVSRGDSLIQTVHTTSLRQMWVHENPRSMFDRQATM